MHFLDKVANLVNNGYDLVRALQTVADKPLVSDKALGVTALSITAPTTGGSSTAYTLTTGLESAPADGDTIFVNFHTTCGDNPTLNVDSLGAWEIDYYNGFKAQAGAIRPGVHRFTRSGSTWVCDDPDEVIVDGDALASDYSLQVGERAKYSPSAATSLALQIATNTTTGKYQISASGNCTPSSSYALLNPNSTTYTGAFDAFRTGTTSAAGGTAQNSSIGSLNGVIVSIGSSNYHRTVCVTHPATGPCFAESRTYFNDGTNRHDELFGARWAGPSAAWSSLGTVVWPSAWTGEVIVERIG